MRQAGFADYFRAIRTIEGTPIENTSGRVGAYSFDEQARTIGREGETRQYRNDEVFWADLATVLDGGDWNG